MCSNTRIENINMYSKAGVFSIYQGDYFNILENNKVRIERRLKEIEADNLAKGLIAFTGLAVIAGSLYKNIDIPSSSSHSSSVSNASTSSNSNSPCKDFASLFFNIENKLELEPRLNINPPEDVSFEGGGGFIFSNKNSSNGTVNSHFGKKCIKGDYNFTYSYINSGKRHTSNRQFYLDGKYTGYHINISGNSVYVSGF